MMDGDRVELVVVFSSSANSPLSAYVSLLFHAFSLAVPPGIIKSYIARILRAPASPHCI